MTVLQSIKDGYDFERLVCSILYKTNPYQLSYYDGGPDRGRDIVLQYKYNGVIYNVIAECKFYKSGVSKEVILPALSWATVHQPAFFYLWIVPYLTPAAKDFIREFEKRFKITVHIEEQINIEQYIKYLKCDNAAIWTTLREKIMDACVNGKSATPFIPEYDLRQARNKPFLVDREFERKELIYQSQKAFYLQGVSACGKTQLLKYVAFVYTQKGLPIFWHTIRPGDIEQQCRDFFHSFARYFESVHHDPSLLTYFDTYGYFLTQDMENLIVSMLKQYNPILFIDDAHNCQNENISMRSLFAKLIRFQVCRIFFSGWFNIFNLSPPEKANISTIVLEGMKKNELDQIIHHCSGKHNLEVAEIIEKNFYGLPGYAVLADKEIAAADIEDADSFLVRFLTLLSPQEQVVLFALSLLSTDVSGDFLKSNGYYKQAISLKNKNLLVSRRGCYAVHDKYRLFFSQCTPEKDIRVEVIAFIESYAALTPSVFLDLISFHISQQKHITAWNILCHNFRLLLSCQFYNQLLSHIQEIERNAQGRININEIILKKIVLLERLTEYTVCLQYIHLFDDKSLLDTHSHETFLYIQLRCLYFTNKYDEILEVYKQNYQDIESFCDRELYTQILLVIGRVFYIRGSSKGALIYYLLAYQTACEFHYQALEVKTIHRIAMIERRMGMAAESRDTFEALSHLKALTTPKRLSYIFYRIAKCYLNEGDLEQAKIYNEKSVKIKESYNDIRGLLFSENLNALICLKKGDYLDAYCSSSNACNYANQLGLNKEWLSSALVRLRSTLLLPSWKEGLPDSASDLQRCLKIATEEKLLLRLKSIEKLTKDRWSIICQAAMQIRQTVEEELKNFEEQLTSHYLKQLNPELQKNFEALVLQNSSISRFLLLHSGFIDPLAHIG